MLEDVLCALDACGEQPDRRIRRDGRSKMPPRIARRHDAVILMETAAVGMNAGLAG